MEVGETPTSDAVFAAPSGADDGVIAVVPDDDTEVVGCSNAFEGRREPQPAMRIAQLKAAAEAARVIGVIG